MAADDLERVVFVSVIHTDLDSVEEARRVVKETKPDVVAVELDHERYQLLTDPQKEENIAPFAGDAAQDLMQQLAMLEKSLGEITGSNVGDEMIAAIEEGREVGAKIALVDRPMPETIRAMMQVPMDELYRLIGMLPDATKDIEEGSASELLNMLKEEGAVNDLMGQFKKEFPRLAEVLIEQRDQYVAKALKFILNDVEGKIVVVLGAGHIQGVKAALENLLQESN
ncbi:MAG: TraB/GumN family protein [Candidatus Thorarchaeota archaeon]